MPPFGRIVGHVAAVRFRRSAARHVDDDAGALARHAVRRAMGTQERALQVHAQHLVPPGFIAVQEMPRGIDVAGVIHQNVHVRSAQAIEHRVHSAPCSKRRRPPSPRLPIATASFLRSRFVHIVDEHASPSRPNRSATARPIPCPAPVTSAIFPTNRCISYSRPNFCGKFPYRLL